MKGYGKRRKGGYDPCDSTKGLTKRARTAKNAVRRQGRSNARQAGKKEINGE